MTVTEGYEFPVQIWKAQHTAAAALLVRLTVTVVNGSNLEILGGLPTANLSFAWDRYWWIFINHGALKICHLHAQKDCHSGYAFWPDPRPASPLLKFLSCLDLDLERFLRLGLHFHVNYIYCAEVTRMWYRQWVNPN